MLWQIFLSPHLKRYAIVTYKHGIDELPHELPNDLRLVIIGNQEISGKCPSVQSLCQNENFVNTSKKTLEKQKINVTRSALFHMETRVSLRYL